MITKKEIQDIREKFVGPVPHDLKSHLINALVTIDLLTCELLVLHIALDDVARCHIERLEYMKDLIGHEATSSNRRSI